MIRVSRNFSPERGSHHQRVESTWLSDAALLPAATGT